MKINELTSYFNELLDVGKYQDYCPNGLQIAGTEHIKKVVTGVSACQELFEKAVAVGAETIIVHHGFFWRNEAPQLLGVKRTRLGFLLQHNLNLLAYHLPLDYHSEIGNNILLAKELGVKVKDFSEDICYGEFSKDLTIDECEKHLQKKLQHRPLIINASSNPIKKVALCCGAAADYLEQAAQFEIDTFITGEINERSVYLARECGIHLIAAGHYATEQFGIQALGKHLAERFSIKHEFIPLVNPV